MTRDEAIAKVMATGLFFALDGKPAEFLESLEALGLLGLILWRRIDV